MSNLPSEAVALMRQEILSDPSFVVELAQMAGLPTAQDLLQEQEARAAMEEEQESRLHALETALQNVQLTPGPQGERGLQGVAGSPGAKGETGARGEVGPKGDTGSSGAVGATGATGSVGATGATGATGAAGTNATTTAIATATANGLMSAADKSKLDKLGILSLTDGTAAIPVIAGGGATDITVTFSTALAGTTFNAIPSLVAGAVNLGSLTPTVKSVTATAAVITLKNNGLLAITVGGTLLVLAYSKA